MKLIARPFGRRIILGRGVEVLRPLPVRKFRANHKAKWIPRVRCPRVSAGLRAARARVRRGLGDCIGSAELGVYGGRKLANELTR